MLGLCKVPGQRQERQIEDFPSRGKWSSLLRGWRLAVVAHADASELALPVHPHFAPRRYPSHIADNVSKETVLKWCSIFDDHSTARWGKKSVSANVPHPPKKLKGIFNLAAVSRYQHIKSRLSTCCMVKSSILLSWPPRVHRQRCSLPCHAHLHKHDYTPSSHHAQCALPDAD